MRNLIAGLVLSAFFATAPALAQRPGITPTPDWVVEADVKGPSPATETGAVRMILADTQMRFSVAGDERYNRSVFKILTSQGLANAGTIALAWNPETETLNVHKLTITRGAQVIDVLAKQEFLVLRRETNLQFAMLDGVLTATLQPEGLKVGDVIDLAATLTRRDPVMQGKSENYVAAMSPSPVDHMRLRALWSPDKPMVWRATEDVDGERVQKVGDQTEFVFDLRSVEPARGVKGAPMRYQVDRLIEFSEFKTWADVSSLFAPLYEKAGKIAADSDLRVEIDRIKAASKDPKDRAAAALALVQEQVRYVFLGMELGALKPADADRTWARRFGDCKGKTALLLALLHELGVEAEPALVSSTQGDGLDKRLPQVGMFDHILVRATIAGKVYWLDGTRMGDGVLDQIVVPAFSWALPVRPAGGSLQKLALQSLDKPQMVSILELDATGGVEAKAPAHAELVMRGDMATAFRLGVESVPASELDRTLKQHWTQSYRYIEPKTVSQSFDAATGEIRLVMDGTATMDWDGGWSRPAYEIDGAWLGGSSDFTREPGPGADAPFEVGFPMFVANKTTIKLADGGKGYVMRGEDVDKVVAGVEYKRKTAIKGGVLTMDSSVRSIAQEFPASEAEAASKAIKEISKVRVFVLAPGSSTVSQQAVMAMAMSGDRDTAIQMLNEAIAEDPAKPENYILRGTVQRLNNNLAEAVKDVGKAIEIRPTADAYVLRASLRDDADMEGKRADIAAALAIEPNAVQVLVSGAHIESDAGAHDKALAYLDRALGLRAGDPNLLIERGTVHAEAGHTQLAIDDFGKARASISGEAGMLNSLCWAKGTTGVALESGLEDCNASLAAEAGNPATLDSRGLVELKLGQFDKAIADYDEALKRAPTMSGSLFCRGIAKLRKGLQAEGEADLAAARKLSPGVDKRFAAYGVKP